MIGRKVGLLGVLLVAVGGGATAVALVVTSSPEPHTATRVVHIRTTDVTTPTTTTTTTVQTPPAIPSVIQKPSTLVTTPPVPAKVTTAPATAPAPVADPTPTTEPPTTTTIPAPDVPSFVDASCSASGFTIQGQMSSAQAGVTVQLLIADTGFLVTTTTDAAGDFTWAGTGPTCAPDLNLFVGMFGSLSTVTTSCEIDCYESPVTVEQQ